jgi:hypothetical protein
MPLHIAIGTAILSNSVRFLSEAQSTSNCLYYLELIPSELHMYPGSANSKINKLHDFVYYVLHPR